MIKGEEIYWEKGGSSEDLFWTKSPKAQAGDGFSLAELLGKEGDLPSAE